MDALEGFEEGVVQDVTLQHLHDLDEPWLTEGLISENVPSAELMRELRRRFPLARFVASSNTARVSSKLFTKGDVVLYRDAGAVQLGEVFFFARTDDLSWVCISAWDRMMTPNDSTWTRTYRKCERPRVLPLATLLTPVAYLDTPKSVTVLVPCMYR